MPRVKRGVNHVKKRRKLLSKVKGFRNGQKNLIKKAKEAVIHAGVHAFVDRRKKKGVNRALWQIKISAFVKKYDLSYSKFIGLLKSKNIEIDRKVLADLSENNEKVMESLIKEIKVD